MNFKYVKLMEKLKMKTLFSPTPSGLKKGAAVALCMILTGLFFVVGCKKDNPMMSGGGGGSGNGGAEPQYPIDISFTKYSLAETCQWTNLAYDNTVIVVNSDEELRQYVVCTRGGYPEIDFSQQTLLLASGSAGNGISKITVTNLQQLSLSEYKLDMEILLNDSTTTIEQWAVALIVEKVSEESRVELNVIEYPIEIPFTEYFIHWNPSLSEFSCWKNILPEDGGAPGWLGKLSVVNSTEELENYLICTGNYPAIDFSKHTLLLASGCTSSGIYPKVTVNNLREFSLNEYVLDIEVFIDDLCVIDYWAAVLIVEKMSKESIIDLKICHNYYDWKYCEIIKTP
jgi:hypothetical protein